MIKKRFFNYFGFIFLIGVLQISSCGFWNDKCYPTCETPNRYKIYEAFPVEKQFEFYRNCACWTDSITDTGILEKTLLERDDIVEFLVKTLKTEKDPDVLTDAISLLSYVGNRKYNVYAKDLRGKEDINVLVKNTISKIPEKDERDLFDKILGKKKVSRKEQLERDAKEIEEQTKYIYEVEVKTSDEKGKKKK